MKKSIPLLWISFPHICPQPVKEFSGQLGKNITILILISLSFGPVSLFAFTPVTTEIQVESTAGLCSNITKEEQK